MSKEDTCTLGQPSLTESGKQDTVTDRPRTRQFVKEQEGFEKRKYVRTLKDEKPSDINNEPRRSNRDYNRIRFKRNATFYRSLERLFFLPGLQKPLTMNSVGGSRLQLRCVYESPHIYEIDDFLSEAELQYFDDVIKKCSFQKSFVDNMQCDSEGAVPDSPEAAKTPKRSRRTLVDSTHRTSTFFAFNHRADSMIRAIEQKTADLLGCWIHQIEGLQLVRYLPGQFFGVHHDMGDLLEDDQVLLPRKHLVVKRRLVTLFAYLNDLTEDQGGCTYFPKCDHFRVRPKKGMAVLWSNVDRNGYPDPNTIHAGETVLSESQDTNVVKYGLNIWITEE